MPRWGKLYTEAYLELLEEYIDHPYNDPGRAYHGIPYKEPTEEEIKEKMEEIKWRKKAKWAKCREIVLHDVEWVRESGVDVKVKREGEYIVLDIAFSPEHPILHKYNILKEPIRVSSWCDAMLVVDVIGLLVGLLNRQIESEKEV